MKDSWTMRHFIGLILGLVLAAAVFFGGGWGAEHVSALAGHSVGLPSRTGLNRLGALLWGGLPLGRRLARPRPLLAAAHDQLTATAPPPRGQRRLRRRRTARPRRLWPALMTS